MLTSTTPASADPGVNRSAPVRVVILADDLSDADSLAQRLRQAGFDAPCAAASGPAELAAAATAPPDLIVALELSATWAAQALEILRDQRIDAPLIMVCSEGKMEGALPECLRRSAAAQVPREHLDRFADAALRVLAERRRQVDVALHTTRLLLGAALGGGEAGTYRWELPSGTVQYDPSVGRLFGQADLSVTSPERFYQLVHRDDRAAVRDRLECCLRDGTDFDLEYRVVWPDGSVHWLADRARIERGRDGRPAYLIGACAEITGRKLNQDALLRPNERLELRVAERTAALSTANQRLRGEVAERTRAQTALRATSELLERVFDATHVLLAYLDPDFNFIRVNRAYAEADQRAPEWFVGRNHFAVYPHPENEVLFRRVVATGEACAFYARPFQYAGQPERGVTYWDWSLHPLKGASGAVEGLVLCLVDVTKREQAEEKLRRTERLLSMGTFAAGIAHEINNPLTSILLTARHAQRHVTDAAEIRSVLDEIIDDTERCARIVKGVLCFARHEPTEKSALDLRTILVRARQFLHGTLQQRAVTVALDLPPALPLVLGNRTALEQLFMNLVLNGVEASAPGSEVRVTAQALESSARVQVADAGCGMTPEERAHAFDPFYASRKKPASTGLGLSMAHGIVNEHGGSISIDTQPGHGTTVTVELPRVGNG